MPSVFDRNGEDFSEIFPNSSFQNPDDSASSAELAAQLRLAALLTELIDRFDGFEKLLQSADTASFAKEWHTVGEAAEVLNRASFSVCE